MSLRPAHAAGILPSQRDLFRLPDDVAYLNCANMSPQLRTVTEAGLEAVKRKESPWTLTSDDWFGGAEALRTAVAQLIGGDAEGIALIPAVSYGIAVAAANIPVRAGQNILVLHDQFPSNLYAWRELARSTGAEVRTVQKSRGDDWTDAVCDAIEAQTAVVTVPNCHWTDGALVDLAKVGECARAVGAAFVVDASQSLGAYPLAIDDVQPDFLASVSYKWQLGPYGLGYLYVAPKWRDSGRPLEASWLTRRGAEDFTRLVDYTDGYRPGARRFDTGGFPQFVLSPMALAGVTQLLEWGVERVQSSVGRLTTVIGDEAMKMGCSVLPTNRRVGHMVGIRFPDGIPAGFAARLCDERVYVSIRGDSVRVAPHLYNSEDDAARFLAVLGEFV